MKCEKRGRSECKMENMSNEILLGKFLWISAVGLVLHITDVSFVEFLQ